MQTCKLKVGDVITSPDFPYCQERDNANKIFSYTWSVKECFLGLKNVTTSLACVDKTRATREYIVISVLKIEGGMEQGGGYYNSTREVTVQKLNEDGYYNPDEEKLYFL